MTFTAGFYLVLYAALFGLAGIIAWIDERRTKSGYAL